VSGSTTKVTYGLIGFGGLAENRIARESFDIPVPGRPRVRHESSRRARPVLKGVTDIDSTRRHRALALGLRWYDSVHELLEDDSIRAVYISSNNKSHYSLAKQVLESGRHCLVEKPMATTLEEAQELCRIAKQNCRSLSVDHMMVHNSYNARARDILRKATLGFVNDFSIHMEFLFGTDSREAESWRCVDPEELGGPIGDVGSHCLYMAEFLTSSRISKLACAYLPASIPINVENGAMIHVILQNGIQGSIGVAFNRPRGGPAGTLLNLGYEIYGTEGILRACGTMFQLSGSRSDPVRIRMCIESAARTRWIRVKRPNNIYREAVAQHALSIADQAPDDCADGVRNLRLILASRESARDNSRWIDIPS